jgi:FSR family fosmidomycin resistance protein-like MFS transporter
VEPEREDPTSAGSPGGARPVQLPRGRPQAPVGTVYSILVAIGLSHLLNDAIQSLIPATYPLVKEAFHLNFVQVGLITLAFQLTASLLQPLVGLATDRRPMPYSLAIGMCVSLAGLVLLSVAGTYPVLLGAVALVGVGSSIFHPESSRVAHLAAGNRRGFAQSIFQVGGNTGGALGPLAAALVLGARGHTGAIWFAPLALVAIVILSRVGAWYRHTGRGRATAAAQAHRLAPEPLLPRGRVRLSVAVLLVLIFSKFFYLASMTSYYTFYLIDRFSLTVRQAQIQLFLFQLAVAVGTLVGGQLGDRYGRKYVIWVSILGAAPLTLLMPHVGQGATTALAVAIGLVLSSAFPAILVYAQELLPGRLGLISGLFYGFAFGMGGVGSAALGALADATSIRFVYEVCSFLPLLGLLTGFLPDLDRLTGRGRSSRRRPAA